jgi:hypothetical protein
MKDVIIQRNEETINLQLKYEKLNTMYNVKLYNFLESPFKRTIVEIR